MEKLEGLEEKFKEELFGRLKKILHGLKQVREKWYKSSIFS